MLLLENESPLHRTFPSDFRYKVEFVSEHTDVFVPPIYLFIDNHSSLNVDTRYLTSNLRNAVADMFESMFNEHFSVLTVQKILEAADDPRAILTQYAQLTQETEQPGILVRYYDLTRTYQLNARRTRISRIHIDDIPRDIITNTPV